MISGCGVFLSCWISIFFIPQLQIVAFFTETVTISGCETSRLMLTCRHLHTIIAIIDVDYQIVNDSQLNNDSTNNGYISPFPLVHPREALNRR